LPERSVTHATIVVERIYDASPARVFAAWADPAVKLRWFAGPDDWELGDYELDFRVGGRESISGGPPGGPVHIYDAIYRDIVPDQCIVLTYDMSLDETRISVSLATVELKPVAASTRLTYTEQGAYLDGHDVPDLREQGMGTLLDALGAELRDAPRKTR
jgi:uncharacterized protein YndB with AHSA1/START domain